jgi:hypothetical protein
MSVIKTIDVVGVSADWWRDAADGVTIEYHSHSQVRFRISR